MSNQSGTQILTQSMNGLLDIECNELNVSNVLETDQQSLGLDYIYGFEQPSNVKIGTGSIPTTIFSCYGSPNTTAEYTININSPFSISQDGETGQIDFAQQPSNVSINGSTPVTVYSFVASANNMRINIGCNIPISFRESGSTSGNSVLNTDAKINSASILVYRDGVLFQTFNAVPLPPSYGSNYSYTVDGTSIALFYYNQYIFRFVNTIIFDHIANGNTATYEIKVALNSTINRRPLVGSNTFGYIANTTMMTFDKTVNVSFGTTTSTLASVTSFNVYWNYAINTKINSGTIYICRNGAVISSSAMSLTNDATQNYSYSVAQAGNFFNYNQYMFNLVKTLTLYHENSSITSFYEIKVSLNTTISQSPVVANRSIFNYIFNTTQGTIIKSANVSNSVPTRTGYSAKSYSSVFVSGKIGFFNGTGSILENELLVNRIFTKLMITTPYYVNGSFYFVPAFQFNFYPSNTYFINYPGDVEIFLTKMSDIYIGIILYFRKIAPTTNANIVTFTASLNCRLFNTTSSNTSVNTLTGGTNTTCIYSGNGDWNFCSII